jgi:hypothetical protein
VSRLHCVFAFESRVLAMLLAAEGPLTCLEVAPADERAPMSCHDSWWISGSTSRAGAQPISSAASAVTGLADQLRRSW